MSTDKLYKSNNYQSVKFQKKTLDSGFIIGLSQHHTGSNNYEDWLNGVHRYGHIDFGLIVRENSHANALKFMREKKLQLHQIYLMFLIHQQVRKLH